MSKLFDKRDCEWELTQIDRAEQESSGTMTGFQMAQMDRGIQTQFERRDGTIGYKIQNWEGLRRATRMKLLKTGQLMSDMRVAVAKAKACPKCRVTKDSIKGCDAHGYMLRIVIMAVKQAGEDNMATRLAQGRVWGEEEPRTAEDHGINHWESWYQRDKREGVWPGTKAYTGTQDDVAKLKFEYGDLGYKGWLQMLLENEEISQQEFLAEKGRLNAYCG